MPEAREGVENRFASLEALDKEVRTVLRDYRSPVDRRSDAWLSSCLVKRELTADDGLSAQEAVERVFSAGLHALGAENPQAAELLRLRFIEGKSPSQLRSTVPWLAFEHTSYFDRQRSAVEALARRLIEQESACRNAALPAHPVPADLLWRLPLPGYRRNLLGIDRPARELLAHLRSDASHIVCIKGIGGIGKTALADHCLRVHLATRPRLADLIWITAKQEYLTVDGIVSARSSVNLEAVFDQLGQALRLVDMVRRTLPEKVDALAQVLRRAPYLVVIDNLEEAKEFKRILPLLERLAGPTKFLLTTRETVPAIGSLDEVSLGQLDRSASLELVRQVAEEKHLENVPAEEIVQTVGGNPLAIIWVVSLMQGQGPAAVLADVRAGRAEDIYLYIFRKSWSVLSMEARRALMSMQRAGDEADWEWLSEGWQGDPQDLRRGLSQLTALSLADLSGPQTYSIHRLTSTFLLTEVLQWKRTG